MMNRLPVETPAFVYDEACISADCARIAQLAHESGCKLLFSVKALALAGVLETVGHHVDGFSASSQFEALLVHNIVGPDAVIHTTCPGLRTQDLVGILRTSKYLSFNSVSQLERLGPGINDDVQLGIRVNPGLSLLSDARYDPCRRHSKLGATPQEISAVFENARIAARLSGLHVHNNCDAETFGGFLRTVRHLDDSLERVLRSIGWINLGGGYTFRAGPRSTEFEEAIELLRSKYGVDVFIEPGAALVRRGVQLVASVVDLFERDQRKIAVLDTSVNHAPEAFEYGDVPDNEPWVLGHVDDGSYSYQLAGCTCLAGDIFGDYSFVQPLIVGDQIVFLDMGAYAFSKAHWFNGTNLPNIYAKSSTGDILLKQQFTFTDFARHNAVPGGLRTCD